MMQWPDAAPYDPRRLIHRVIHYWRELAGVRAMPEENDIDPDALGRDWDYCFLMQSRDVRNTVDYNFTYLGDEIRRAYADTVLDQYNQFIISPNANSLSNHFERVLATEALIIEENQFVTLYGRKVLYRQCMLPLGNPEIGVQAIFGAMNYKIEG